MRASCCICSDILDEVNPISAAPCGHVYHSNCLMLWINQSSKTCPVCRIRVSQEKVLKLYFNFPSTSALNTSVLENEVLNLKANLSAKSIELESCLKQKESTVAFVREAEKKAADLQQIVYKNESEIAELRVKLKSAIKSEAKVFKLEQMNVALSNDLQHLNNVRSIVNGTQEDVNNIIKECGNGSEATRQMATYSTVLKRELQKVISSKDKLLEQNAKLKQENGRFAAKVKFYEDAMAVSTNSDETRSGKNSKSIEHKSFSLNLNKVSDTSASSSSASNIKISSKVNIKESPLSVPFNKSKFNMCIIASTSDSYKLEAKVNLKRKHPGIAPISVVKENDQSSIIRTGYNGLGGHSNFINSSDTKRFKNLKRKI